MVFAGDHCTETGVAHNTAALSMTASKLGLFMAFLLLNDSETIKSLRALSLIQINSS